MEEIRRTIISGLTPAEHTGLRVLAAKADSSVNRLLLAMVRDLLKREGVPEKPEEFSPAFKRILKVIDG